jgi:hypothetical protein
MFLRDAASRDTRDILQRSETGAGTKPTQCAATSVGDELVAAIPTQQYRYGVGSFDSGGTRC